MFFEILLAIFLGIFIGIISGLLPGIHINLVSVITVSVSPLLLTYVSPLSLAIFIVALGVTHTFLDTIPSIFLGAPDPDMVLAVLPGHRMLLEGKGYEAVKLTVFGSFFCLLITLVLMPLLVPFLPWLYDSIQPYMGALLLLTVLAMIWLERGIKKKFFALYVVVLGGALGLLVLNMPNLRQPLFPMLSGLFGISTLLLSLGENVKIPLQKAASSIKVGAGKTFKALSVGVFSGSLTGLFPGKGYLESRCFIDDNQSFPMNL